MALHDLTASDYASRVAYGKQMEERIFQYMQSVGFTIVPATKYEDMHLKIDAHVLCARTWKSMQIKYRKTGDDILMEVVFLDTRQGEHKAIDPSMTLDGRDMVGSSELYACLSRNGRHLRICETYVLKHLATTLTRRLLAAHARDQSVTRVTDVFGEARITTDKASRRRKVMFFARLESLSVSYQSVAGTNILQ